MTAAVFSVVVIWTLLAVVAGVVIGTAIHNADKPADELAEPEADEFRWDVSA